MDNCQDILAYKKLSKIVLMWFWVSEFNYNPGTTHGAIINSSLIKKFNSQITEIGMSIMLTTKKF